jgi:hypothetical protein
VPATIRHQTAKTSEAAIDTLVPRDRAVAARDRGDHRLGYRLLYYLRQLSPFARALGRRHKDYSRARTFSRGDPGSLDSAFPGRFYAGLTGCFLFSFRLTAGEERFGIENYG